MKKELFINIWDYKNKKYPFQIFIGGRGTGKTFSALRGVTDGSIAGKVIYMRRKTEQLEYIADSPARGEGANPFKPINNMYGTNLGFSKIQKNLIGLYERTVDKDGKFEYSGAPIGYGLSLVGVSNVRGLDFSDCTDLIYDEFIKEKHEKTITGEAKAFLNAYETINRNREFDGNDPVYVWMLSNSDDIYNPMFVGLGLVNQIERMIASGKSDCYLEARGIAVHLLKSSEEFIEKKSATALYKLTAGSEFSDMALNNSFSYNDFSLIEHRNLRGYIPVCGIGPAWLYRKKSASEVYVSYSPAQVRHYSAENEQDKMCFYKDIGCTLHDLYVRSALIFESYELKQIILDMIV